MEPIGCKLREKKGRKQLVYLINRLYFFSYAGKAPWSPRAWHFSTVFSGKENILFSSLFPF
jgi:hypothetical protein